MSGRLRRQRWCWLEMAEKTERGGSEGGSGREGAGGQ